jgi:hypothetical protein
MDVRQLAERVVAEVRRTGAPVAEVARRVLEEVWDSLSDEARQELLVRGLLEQVEAAEWGDAGQPPAAGRAGLVNRPAPGNTGQAAGRGM